MENNEQVTLGKEIIVQVNERNIRVKKLGLLSYARLTGAMKEVIASVIELFRSEENLRMVVESEDNADIYAFSSIIARLIEKNIQQVITLLDIAVPDLGKEYIENNVGLEDVIVLFNAILEVNNIIKVIDEGKKLIENLIRSKM